LNFTDEPTGLAFDSSNGRLYICDDDNFKLYWVNPANPSTVLGQFDLKPLADFVAWYRDFYGISGSIPSP
jgi:hypothetical protein